MNKLKIAKELDTWVKDNFGDNFFVNANDGDLNLGVYIERYIDNDVVFRL